MGLLNLQSSDITSLVIFLVGLSQMAGSGPVLIAFSSHYLFRRLTMVRGKDIAGSWAYFLSLFDVFIHNINSTILMPNLVSDVKSLLIELSSGSKYEYIQG